MKRRLGGLIAFLACLLMLSWLTPPMASAIPGISDCKDSPTPEMPGRGLAGFFYGEPDTLPPERDPFEPDADTTIYEQYGYAGLRWHTYDLGCGPDALRHPDAVIGTSVSNWLVQLPIAFTALTGSVTQLAFKPELLGAFDSSVASVSSALHENLFVSWIPFVLAALGAFIIFKARKASMATSAAAVGWALIVILLATALFRWPVEAGRAADATVTGTLGAAVSELDGYGGDIDPGTAVASNINEAILYRAWLAGTVGSPDSETARRYGPALFKANALTWREAKVIQENPERGQAIIERKNEEWKVLAEMIQEEDPEAYEYLSGVRSETRVGYAVLSTLGVFLALPFLLMSALLLLGCFIIVRLAVMLFPAFATLGAFPASRGLVIGLGRTVGAAVVNAIVFGVGAGVTIAVLGVLLHPGGGAPGWVGLVLMPLFTLVMWVALKPFRRLTAMVDPDRLVPEGRRPHQPRWLKRVVMAGLSGATSGVAAGVTTAAAAEDDSKGLSPERAEARPSASPDNTAEVRVPVSSGPPDDGARTSTAASPRPPSPSGGGASTEQRTVPPRHRVERSSAGEDPAALGMGFAPQPREEALRPAFRDEFDDEDVYVIYRPEDNGAPEPA